MSCGIMNGRYLKVLVLCIIGGVVLHVFSTLLDMKNTSNKLQTLLTELSKERKDVPFPKPLTSRPFSGRKMPDVDTSVLAGVRKKGLVKNLPRGEQLKAMDADGIWKTYHSYTDNIDIICERRLRMGKIGNGGWEVCDDPPYRPIKPCIVYSFGINFDFSFDDDVVKSYECDVYSFDPSMSMKTQRRKRKNMFYKIGIGGKDETNDKKWQLMTLTSIRKMLNHSKSIIDVLKMDVEKSEWASVPSMLEAGELKTVRQLLLEFHTGWQKTYEEGLSKLKLMSDLEQHGFRRFAVNKNPSCMLRIPRIFPLLRTGCQEVHFVNINLLP
ncbi:methyltransferase-like protein 24 isoform X2 [Gigantopelta aegis]|uniref:methyltransferase-like protein 24 isoform X2 n=1 Tax=Gigantopelta aegis TaxID=1735272 RepID=UPI001B888277|nr:methyltransferase-like protein 24 isoform X2 [Gigantopelta aegis]